MSFYFVSSLIVAASDEVYSIDDEELGVYATVAERFRVLCLRVGGNSSSNINLSTLLSQILLKMVKQNLVQIIIVSPASSISKFSKGTECHPTRYRWSLQVITLIRVQSGMWLSMWCTYVATNLMLQCKGNI